ncbi:MAG: terpene cyclase/mutase family protein [Planctomycetes bacterium]|nr:terpene cyclase/mutase family protein [Planctomycetota bacterium]
MCPPRPPHPAATALAALLATVLAAALVAAPAAPAPAPTQDPAQDPPPSPAATLAERVNRAIDAGVAHLKSIQRDDGHFPCDHPFQDGTTALCAFALLKSGVPNGDPAIVQALAALRYEPFRSIYATSCRIALFDAHGGVDLAEPIRAAAAWIEQNQHESGRFAYPWAQPDLSNSQYAAFGLWIASRHGFTARRDTWAALLKELLRLQAADGGFGYHEGDVTTGSMTTAAIAMAQLAIDALAGDSRHGWLRQKGEKLLEKSWSWLEDHFTVAGNPLGTREVIPGNHLYYLYGLERVGAIGERKLIGPHDWYAEGARHLVKVQRDGGAWSSPDATSFALLFLRRATFTGMKKQDGEQPLGGPLSDEPVRPGLLVPFLRRWHVCGPHADPKDALLQEPYAGEATVEPSTGATFRGKPWRELRALGDRVEFGDARGPGERTLHYACAWLHVTAPFDGALWVGGDDGFVVQLDGKTVIERHVHQPTPRDRSTAAVQLAPGVHRLLVKLENDSGESWFTLRFADRDGKPARQLRPSLSKRDPQLPETALAMPGLFTLAELAATLPLLPKRTLDFKAANELEPLAFDRNGISAGDLYPQWIDTPQKRDGQPHPGGRGIVALHPPGEKVGTRVLLRAALPAGTPKLVLRTSSEAFGNPAKGDFALKVGVFDAAAMEVAWLQETVIGPSPKPAAPDASGWRDVVVDLSAHAGQERLIVIECAAGGGEAWNFEHAFLDAVAIR